MDHLPAPLLVNILERVGTANEVGRAATSCRALWTACAAQLTQVHDLAVYTADADLQTDVLQQLFWRFPCITKLQLSDACWHWDGRTTLPALANTLKVLRADDTSFPLLSKQPIQQAQQPQQQQQQGSGGQPVSSACQQAPHTLTGVANPRPAAASDIGSHRHTQLQLQEQLQPSIPHNLCGLHHMQMRRLVTSPVKCRVHGSTECMCMEHTFLAALVQQNSHLTSLDLAGNSGLPDRLMHAAVLAASCCNLAVLNLSGCSLLRPGPYIPAAFAGLQELDVSNTAVTDADVMQLAAGLPGLRVLSLAGCRRVSNVGVAALAIAPAVLNGKLTSLDLGGLTRPSAASLANLTAAWVGAMHTGYSSSSSSSKSGNSRAVTLLADDNQDALCGSPGGSNRKMPRLVPSPAAAARQMERKGSSRALLHMALSRTGGITDQVLGSFLIEAAQDGRVLEEQLQSDSHGLASMLQALSLQAEAATAAIVPSAATAAIVPSAATAAIVPSADSAISGEDSSSSSHYDGGLQLLSALVPVGLCGLHVAGCNAISSSMLLQLGQCGVLAQLTSLDLSDMEALRQPQQLPVLTTCRPGHCILAQLTACMGTQLQVLALDGCYMDDATAACIAAYSSMQQLSELSLVGCRGLSSAGMRLLLGSLPSLASLAIGGSMSAWSEGDALAGLPCVAGLTQLKLVRRPALRDVELAPVLAASVNLRSLSLIGCYVLTDKLFELAASAAGCCSSSQQDGCIPGLAAAGREGGGTACISSPDAAAGNTLAAMAPCVCSNTSGGSGGVGSSLLAVGVSGISQQLTQLILTACDSMTLSSVPRLRALRHLRVSFCASVSAAAVQQLLVSCTHLVLLELPASLQPKLSYTVVHFDAPQAAASGAGSRSIGAAAQPLYSHWGRNSRLHGSALKAHPPPGVVPEQHGVVFPQQAPSSGQHAHKLKVLWI